MSCQMTLSWKGGTIRLATCSCGWLTTQPATVLEARRRFELHLERKTR